MVTNLYTTATGNKRVGVRRMINGLTVYYLPMPPMADQAILPTYVSFFPLFRKILLREKITIVHGHAATSPLEHECILQARTMGYKTVYTDHSLFGFADAASINVNKYLKLTLSDIDHAICVSHTCRENLVLRAALDPRRVSAIPNAVDASKFTPNPLARPTDGTINIVMVSRLVYRKGIDLVVNVIPTICARFPHVRFIIGGDGPKKLLLEEMRERHQLHDRVELLGAVPHKAVRDVLTRGHIFLNASLTESFCIAILEAACCGCYIVSTRVGGVPEVLPQRMIRFAEPNPDHLIEALAHAIPIAPYVDPHSFHTELRDMYNWPEVAARTVRVYDMISSTPRLPLIERYRRFFGIGRVFGPIAVILSTIQYFFWILLEIITPAIDVDIVPDLPWDDIEEKETVETVKRAHAVMNRSSGSASSTSNTSSSTFTSGTLVPTNNPKNYLLHKFDNTPNLPINIEKKEDMVNIPSVAILEETIPSAIESSSLVLPSLSNTVQDFENEQSISVRSSMSSSVILSEEDNIIVPNAPYSNGLRGFIQPNPLTILNQEEEEGNNYNNAANDDKDNEEESTKKDKKKDVSNIGTTERRNENTQRTKNLPLGDNTDDSFTVPSNSKDRTSNKSKNRMPSSSSSSSSISSINHPPSTKNSVSSISASTTDESTSSGSRSVTTTTVSSSSSVTTSSGVRPLKVFVPRLTFVPTSGGTILSTPTAYNDDGTGNISRFIYSDAIDDNDNDTNTNGFISNINDAIRKEGHSTGSSSDSSRLVPLEAEEREEGPMNEDEEDEEDTLLDSSLDTLSLRTESDNK